MLLPVVIRFPQCPPRSPGCQQIFRPDLQRDPAQLRFVLVCSTLSSCPTDFSPCADLNRTVDSLENKLLINGALSCFLILDSGLFQISFGSIFILTFDASRGDDRGLEVELHSKNSLV